MSSDTSDSTSESERRPGFGLAALVEREMSLLRDQLDGLDDPRERTRIGKDISRLRALMTKLVANPGRRRPPERGVPHPAAPPSGPLPRHGGAAAPLAFDR